MFQKEREQPRKIIHVDCDCFYVAVEIRENPYLLGLPVAVGGRPESRGVIATCNYEARNYGVRSAMASAYALKLCPRLKIIKPRFELYREVSQQLLGIFADYTDQIEPLSLDEAFLDVSQSQRCRGSATLMAQEIRQRAKELTGICVSAGVAPNKFLAKIASDWNKPDGLKVITPVEVEEFVLALPVTKLFGVGKATAARLTKLGIESCADLRALDQSALVQYFGSFGLRLYQLSRGIDERPVEPSRRRKSLSTERTYSRDLYTWPDIAEQLPLLLDELNERFQKIRHEYGISKCFVKLKFGDFTQSTMEEVYAPGAKSLFCETTYTRLMKDIWEREEKSVRLLGVGIRLLDRKNNNGLVQMDLFHRP